MTDINQSALSEFWSEFITSQAKLSKPLLIHQGNCTQIFDQEELFQILAGMIRTGDMSVNCDGELVSTGIELPEVPQSVDDYADFLDEFKTLNNCERLTFTRDGCQRYDPRILSTAHQFLRPYIEYRGLPSKGINAVFIGGDYQETWIGLHNDYCQTFLFPVLGRKKMYLWPPDYFDQIENLMYDGFNGRCLGKMDVTPYKNDAVVLEMDAGDMLYIPPYWWHYNLLEESEPTITISLGIFTYKSVEDYVASSLTSMLNNARDENQFFFAPPTSHESLLEDFDKYIGPVLQTLRNQLLCDYAHKRAFSGFVASEQFLEIPEQRTDAFVLHDFCRIDYHLQRDTSIILILSGKRYEIPYDCRVIQLLRDLNAGRSVPAGEFGSVEAETIAILSRHRMITGYNWGQIQIKWLLDLMCI